MRTTSLQHVAAGLALAAFGFGALAANHGASAPTAQQRYQQERADCLSGASHQAREVCLREAANARDAARRNALGDVDEATLRANALKRCDALPEAHRAACKQRIEQGAVAGSAPGGGKLYEARETVRSAPAAATAPASAPKR